MELNWHQLKEELQKVDSTRLVNFFCNLHPLIIIAWALINIGIPIITLFYYFWQFEFYHPIFWIFIPDSYIYSILFGIFLIGTLVLKKNNQILNIITFIGLVKVLFGYLTLLVFLPSFFSIVSLAAHLVEFIEGLIILLFIKTGNRDFSIATFITILDWFFDFFNPFGLPTIFLYPYHPDYNPNPTAPFIFPFFLVFSVSIFFLLVLIRLKKWQEIQSTV
ncbi:MAG: DUF1405 domain-containing protein [Candidatus Hodarchaeales archaeon]|jgi:uncharacterized membrane protein YpjA